ncbi:MAG: molybdopterin-dependent oxidoreductase, partial [Anaerolineae bacterium]|nr:molybdopterin-dependent oxidoreductase [Anaerolineae bacterium]NIN97046.1 molybdopterin-dependent oxidoreductase [Anaerolineae bacterium]NIQ79994.1 molybdopterin-dependent oxidoreductase [Anaerolineae bacterium]
MTTNPGDGLLLLTPKDWKLRLEGRVRRPFELSYAELLSLPSTQAVATLDCTVGWYSTQIWQGIPLEELLAFAEPQVVVGYVRLQAASGYSKGFLLPH